MNKWFLFILSLATSTAQATTFVVTNLADAGVGTLRDRIFSANTSPDSPHTITFNVPAPFVIAPSNAFNTVTNNTFIDGSTQPGYAGTPIVVLSGTNAATSVYGLSFSGRGGGVRGLRVERFDDASGIVLSGSSNRVEGCHIFSNYVGITISGAGTYATVGGLQASNRNVIAASTFEGIYITAPPGNNVVQGNYIGLNPAGTAAYGATNNLTGISLSNSSTNTIGGTAAGARNVISGSRGEGIKILGASAVDNLVAGNFIGLDALGVTSISNQIGITISASPSNTIGGSASGRNFIAGNTLVGISVFGQSSAGNDITFNYVGLATNGLAVPNRAGGISLGAPRCTIAYNNISGNIGPGLDVTGTNAVANTIFGNNIGLDPLGLNVRSNSTYGVMVQLGASSNRIGISSVFSFDRNLISGNGLAGIYISGTSTVANVVANNYIGTDVSGSLARGNQHDGIWIIEASFTRVGDSSIGSGTANLISGNVGDGIRVQGAHGLNISIEHNRIGLDAAGTGSVGYVQSNGVNIDSGSGHVLGPGANYISGNSGAGIVIGGYTTNLLIQNCYIGTSTSGLARVPNLTRGIFVTQSRDVTIRNNLISGNNNNGLEAVGSSADVQNLDIFGNFIGVGATGVTVVSNEMNGIMIEGVPGTQIGATNAGYGNVIGGNGLNGIRVLSNYNSTGTVIAANFIGTSVTGLSALRNMGDGVFGSYTHNIQVGGPTAAWGNLISGNERGIYLNNSHNWYIANNIIGPNSTVSAALSNRTAGIYVENSATNNVIEANVISGNGGPGIVVDSTVENMRIRGNTIGAGLTPLKSLPNQGPGIFAQGSQDILYGGTNAADGNRIAFNAGPGIAVTSIVSGVRLRHEIYGNLIYSNAGPGIDLNWDGITTNDPSPDADNGLANDFQNFPVLTSAIRGSTYVSGQLVSDSFFNPYRLEFFALTPTQGMVFVGATNIFLPGDGIGTFAYTFAASPPVGSLIYATASTTNKGTSEFSAPVTLVLASADTDGDLMPDAWESAYGLNPAVSNGPGSDADSDGYSDLAEWIADTIPNSSNSFFVITSITNAAPRVVTVPSSSSRVYQLDARTSLLSGAWFTVLTNVPGTGGGLGLNDPAADTTRVYRVGVRLP